MKKILFAILMMMPAMALYAQDGNLAKGKTATASSGTASLAVDGDVGTRWESAFSDSQWLCVDLGSSQSFDLIQIVWEGAYAQSFRILAGDTSDKSAAAVVISVTDQTVTGFPATRNYNTAKTITARYVWFEGVKRATPYGYSFYEIGIYKKESPKLAVLEVSASATKATVGSPVALTLSAVDQYGEDYTLSESVSWTVSPASAGVVREGSYIPSVTGVATLTAKAGKVTSNEITIIGYEGANLAPTATVIDHNPEAAENVSVIFDGNEDGGDWVMHDNSESLDYEVWVTLDLGDQYELNMVSLAFEGASSANYQLLFSEDGDTWSVAKTVSHPTGINAWKDAWADFDTDSEQVRYVKFLSTKAATPYGVKLRQLAVYGVPGEVEGSVLEVYAADDQGVVSLRGELSSETVATIASHEGTAFDLTRLRIPAAITVETANPNALFIVTDEQQSLLKGQRNLVVRDAGAYTAERILLKDGYDVCTGLSIQAAYVAYQRTDIGGLGTTVLPFAAPVPEGARAFELYQYNDATEPLLTFREVAAMEAGKAYLLKGRELNVEATAVTLRFDTPRQTIDDGYDFMGTFAEIPAPTGCYILGTDNAFHPMKAGATIPAFHACVMKSGAATASRLAISFGGGDDDGTTGIHSSSAVSGNVPAVLFDLSGRRVSKPGKGIYIQNGKKILRK